MGRVSGKVAIVTGGASGIGEASARLLAKEGAAVVVADLQDEAGERVAGDLGKPHDYRRLDVTDEQAWQTLIGDVTARHGRLDVLVNCAGVGGAEMSQNVEDATLETWHRINGVNVDGLFLGCKHAIPAIRDSNAGARGGGSIVNISSLAALMATPGLAPYGAGKAAVRQFSKSVAIHCAHRGYRIRCNSVHPGVIQTPMAAPLFTATDEDPERRVRMESLIPMKQLGEPDDIGYCVLYLASDESKYVTGAEFVVDGGWSAV